MAVSAKALFRGVATTTTTTTLYTGPATGTTIVNNIVICNNNASAVTFTLTIDGTDIHTSTSLAASTTVSIDLKQVMIATGTAKLIKGGASTATGVIFHISGAEII